MKKERASSYMCNIDFGRLCTLSDKHPCQTFISMSIIILVRVFDGSVRLTITAMDSKTTNGDLESYPNKHPRSPVVKSEPIEAPSGDIMVRKRGCDSDQ